MIYRLVIFLLLNFAALAIGGLFTSKGVPSDWYVGLIKAPWTPPGWVFGFAWTTIMICFGIYMAYLWPAIENKKLVIALFVLQWILNVGWNPTFFYYHHVLAGLITISALTMVVGSFVLLYYPELKFKTLLVLPYFIWLLIATSLNGYILLNN
ncbi:TspO/MBR family protein [Bacteroidota bacterium]